MTDNATTDPLGLLVRRSLDFETDKFVNGLRIIPSLKVFSIGCVDPRVDPAHILGLDIGEAAVLRNIGGRITPSVLDELALLRKLTQAAGGDFDKGWNLLVVQHTDCGILRMQNQPQMLASFLGVEEQGLPAKQVGDPRAAVVLDVDLLRVDTRLPSGMRSSGYVYDVATGEMELVVAPAP